MIKKVLVDAGSESPREDYPWRPVFVPDPYSDDKNLMHISPRSCVMAGLDCMAKYPVAGLGIDFRVSELDYVWLAVYFDTNLRPIHAGVCKGPRWTRWYEYGGVSMGGFPRTIKTVRRDHIGVEIGTPTPPDNYVLPDIVGPEIDYLDFELEKEIECLSRQGYLYEPGPQQDFKRSMKQELTYFVKDPVQVKQLACFTLLGYCTSEAPDAQYPFPYIELSKVIQWDNSGSEPVPKKSMKYYYRQACTTHLMLQEVNAQGVRACHLTPSFPPYMETLPHPWLKATGSSLGIATTNGVEGTLPSWVVDDENYEGKEMAHGTSAAGVVAKHPDRAGNFRITLPEPGENSTLSNEAIGVVGARDARICYKKVGGKNNYKNAQYRVPHANHTAAGVVDGGIWIDMSDVGEMEIWTMKERCLDSRPVKVSQVNGELFYSSDDTKAPIKLNDPATP